MIKNFLLPLLALVSPRIQDRAWILMYHSISDRDDYFSAVAPHEFEKQMKYIAESGRAVITLVELVESVKRGEALGGHIALTFDDGFRDNYINAFPILKKYNFPATVFVQTGIIDGRDSYGSEMMHHSEIVEMIASGLVAIEPHTETHPKLSKLPREEALREIRDSKKKIEDIQGFARFFAYPFGNFNDETVKIVQDVGFEAAVTVSSATVGPKSDLLRLPRVSIDRATNFSQFKANLTRAADLYELLKKPFKIFV